jgi:hypothetical protein
MPIFNLARAMPIVRTILPPIEFSLVPEHVLDTGAYFRARRIRRLLRFGQSMAAHRPPAARRRDHRVRDGQPFPNQVLSSISGEMTDATAGFRSRARERGGVAGGRAGAAGGGLSLHWARTFTIQALVAYMSDHSGDERVTARPSGTGIQEAVSWVRS